MWNEDAPFMRGFSPPLTVAPRIVLRAGRLVVRKLDANGLRQKEECEPDAADSDSIRKLSANFELLLFCNGSGGK